jgi:hypothetical protein
VHGASRRFAKWVPFPALISDETPTPTFAKSDKPRAALFDFVAMTGEAIAECPQGGLLPFSRVPLINAHH